MPANKHLETAGHHALRKGRVSVADGIYLITTVALDRQKWFANFEAGLAASRCMENAEILGDATMLAWVLMPDHLHMLLQLGERYELSMVINRLKSATARHANRALRRTGSIWEKAFHDHALRKDEELQDVARYIVANPLRAGLVTHLGDYPFWNAVWL